MRKKENTPINEDKCDIVIPVYNAPEWVKFCVYSIFINTPDKYLGKIFLMNDNSNSNTLDCLTNLKNKYPDKIELVTNSKNLGFIKNSNKGLELSKSKYVLLLNTDCIINKNTIPKLISHVQKNSKIGLICPISSNAANLTLEMFNGFSYSQMDSLLEKKFKGMNFDACTVVGNCLMITRKCLDSVGLLDEAYGMGYGEETDYQFKAMEKGFEAKVAIDTYVYHKKEASFGNSKEKMEKVAKNRELFFSRWGDEYEESAKKYALNEPIEYIKNNISDEDKKISADTLFFLPEIAQNVGGSHMVVDIVNNLVINGTSANILYSSLGEYKEIMLFQPISYKYFKEISTKQIVTTLWITNYTARKFSIEKNIPLINFVQGYENYFENGLRYNSVALTHKIADYSLTISNYLYDKLKENFGKDSKVIKNSINYDLLYHENNRKGIKTITVVLRDYVMKGDYILLDIIKKLDPLFKNLNINVVYINKKTQVPELIKNNLVKIKGPVSRLEMADILKNTDIYIDASVNEGFGLLPLEALTCGAVPIVSDSFGNREYMKDGVNGYVIKEVNDVDKYIEKVVSLIKDEVVFEKMKTEGRKTCKNFDSDLRVKEYIKYFSEVKSRQKNKKYSSYELRIIKSIEKEVGLYKEVNNEKTDKRVLFRVSRLIPKPVKNLLKPVITYLYNMYDHS